MHCVGSGTKFFGISSTEATPPPLFEGVGKDRYAWRQQIDPKYSANPVSSMVMTGRQHQLRSAFVPFTSLSRRQKLMHCGPSVEKVSSGRPPIWQRKD